MIREYRLEGARVIHDGRFSSLVLNPGVYFLDLGFDFTGEVFRANLD
jgi:hypothetical protein